MEALRNIGGYWRMVWKEWCYRKAETVGDVEDAVSWWRDNLV